jgi:hypothetical protein
MKLKLFEGYKDFLSDIKIELNNNVDSLFEEKLNLDEAIRPKIHSNEKEVIDLTGTNGNAFYLLARANNLCKQLKEIDPELYDFDKISTEMQSSDYENLINVFDEFFGDYVDLER